MIVFGLVLGRWWWVCIVVGTIVWPVLLLADGTIHSGSVLAAAVIGLANTAVGVGLHQAVLRVVRYWAPRDRRQPD